MRRQRENDSSFLLPFSKCTVSSEWAISLFFSCGHPHKYFNCIPLSLSLSLSVSLSLSLSSYSVSWSSRPASRAKTWTSCAPASALVPRPPSQTPTQNAASSRSTASLCLCNPGFGDSCLPVCIPFLWVKHKATFQSSHRSNQPSASGINTHQFWRLPLAKYPPVWLKTAPSIMW